MQWMLLQRQMHLFYLLFQAIILQELEDAISTSGVKKDTYWKEDSHKWFLENSKSFYLLHHGGDIFEKKKCL